MNHATVFVTKVLSDGRLNLPKSMMNALTGTRFTIKKSGQSLHVVPDGAGREPEGDGRFRLRATEAEQINLKPGDFVNLFCLSGTRIRVLKG